MVCVNFPSTSSDTQDVSKWRKYNAQVLVVVYGVVVYGC